MVIVIGSEISKIISKKFLKSHINVNWSINATIQIQKSQVLEPIFLYQNEHIFVWKSVVDGHLYEGKFQLPIRGFESWSLIPFTSCVSSCLRNEYVNNCILIGNLQVINGFDLFFQVREEINKQISAFEKICGTRPCHIDGHQHVHVIKGM